MSLQDFFSPVSNEIKHPKVSYNSVQIGSSIQTYLTDFPILEGIDIALFGVQDDRNAINNLGCSLGPDVFREHFYPLYEGVPKPKIADLGNIKAGESVIDTYAAVKTVVQELVKQGVLPIIIGGGQDITYAQYQAYEKLEQKVDLVVVDSRIDINEDQEGLRETSSQSFLNKILLHEPNYLFNLSNIGYQSYFVSQESIKVLDKLYFDSYRLGVFKKNIEYSEPVLRNADLISFDIGAIRSSDAGANANASPNGFYGEDACQICRYAGMNDKLSSIGFYEFNPAYDKNGQTAALLSQMVWYFIDGFYNRKKDLPLQPKSAYVIYRTALKEDNYEVVFVKSKKTDRWWMQVPYPNVKSVNERFHLVPCSYEDYKTAIDGDMPDLWWRTYQKLI
ncbi:MAG TPA: formimidoylglutamase [Sphingobacteriaceae bacterium]|nr:formimidoylglutamase [Sphingobacteriaceae bacterium]